MTTQNLTAQFTDATLMPFGIHRGKAMIHVPAMYLLWLFNKGCEHPGVKQYIIDNMDALNKEVKNVRR